MAAEGTAIEARGGHRAAQCLRAGWPLAAGTIILAALWLGPLPALSRTAFSLHMMLHLGVAVVAAPLIAIGMVRLGLRLAEGERMLPVALAASAAEMVAVWGWHAPALHTAAALDGRVFVVQQASFLAAGMVVWLVSFSGRTRAAFGIGALTMLVTFMHMAMLGVLLTLAPDLLYPPEICLGAFGLDRLADQRLGGALMAVGGGTPYLLGGLVLAYRFIAD